MSSTNSVIKFCDAENHLSSFVVNVDDQLFELFFIRLTFSIIERVLNVSLMLVRWWWRLDKRESVPEQFYLVIVISRLLFSNCFTDISNDRMNWVLSCFLLFKLSKHIPSITVSFPSLEFVDVPSKRRFRSREERLKNFIRVSPTLSI